MASVLFTSTALYNNNDDRKSRKTLIICNHLDEGLSWSILKDQKLSFNCKQERQNIKLSQGASSSQFIFRKIVHNLNNITFIRYGYGAIWIEKQIRNGFRDISLLERIKRSRFSVRCLQSKK